tara:strand:- start:7240 stop:8100 length:861 start_codon:yes stop_codon:yes gene_type:complete
MISSKTSFLALIGNPVKHSLSPIMHNAAINYLGLDLVYLAIPCKNKDFEIVINSLKKINCKGLNITIPFKEKVIDHCDEITPIAKKIKAVNTLKLNDQNQWIGTNTDVIGLIHPLKKLNFNRKLGIVLGSGGASRSAIQGLIELKTSNIIIISRNTEKREKLIKDFEGESLIKGLAFDDHTTFEYIHNSDLIINTTPVGMVKENYDNQELPFGSIFWKSLNSKTIVYDLIYNPSSTALLKFSQKKGCKTINGTEMLIAQGIESLAFWTDGRRAPFNIMEDALKTYI